MKHLTLLVTDDRAFDLLDDEYAKLYGDNGGDSDGNAWLPSEPLNSNDDGVDAVVAAGYGQLIYASYTDITNILEDVPDGLKRNILIAASSEDDGPDYDDVCDALEWPWHDVHSREYENRWSGFCNGARIVIAY